MSEDREALLKHYRETREEMLSALRGLSDEQMSEESLDGWSVKDHLAHLALWDELRAMEVERISAGHGPAWRFSADDEDEDFNVVGYKLRRAMTAGQARWELEQSRQRLLDAISSATPRGLDASNYGSAGLKSGHEAEHVEWIKRWRSEKQI